MGFTAKDRADLKEILSWVRDQGDTVPIPDPDPDWDFDITDPKSYLCNNLTPQIDIPVAIPAGTYSRVIVSVDVDYKAVTDASQRVKLFMLRAPTGKEGFCLVQAVPQGVPTQGVFRLKTGAGLKPGDKPKWDTTKTSLVSDKISFEVEYSPTGSILRVETASSDKNAVIYDSFAPFVALPGKTSWRLGIGFDENEQPPLGTVFTNLRIRGRK